MPQYQEPPCPGAQVLDLDTALMDGILGGAVAGGPVDVLDDKMDLPAMMAELESAAAAVLRHEEIPAVFICPISLDPMADPVTLCTGQTYERGNIARWLAMGRRTCPTTMQELWDDALTPNATLQHLILAWFARRVRCLRKRNADSHGRAAELVAALKRPVKGQARLTALQELRALCAAHHAAVPKAIADSAGLGALCTLLGPFTSHAVGSEVVAILASVGGAGCLDPDARAALMQPARVSLVVDMLNEGTAETKINCVRLIRGLMEEKGFRPEVVSSLSLLAGIMRLIRDHRRHPDGVAAGLGLLSAICSHRQVCSMVISVRVVPQLVELLPELAVECLEPALSVLDALAAVPEGSAALKDCPETIPNAVRLLMRVSEACTGQALSLLWAVCKLAPEECAPAAVEAGLAAKLLLVIQSGCGPELKQRAAELLKLCSLNYTATLFISKCKLTRTIQ